MSDLNPAQSLTGHYRYVRTLAALLIMIMTSSGMFASIMVLKPVIAEFGIGHGIGALPYTLFMVGYGCGNVIMGKIADRYGILVPAFIGSLCLPLGLFLASGTDSIFWFCLTQMLLCGLLGAGFSFGPLVADISHWFNARRGLAVGIVISGTYIGGTLWPPLLQHWIDIQGWRDTYIQLAIINLIIMFPLACVFYRRPHIEDDPSDASKRNTMDNPLGMSKNKLQGCICVAGIGCCVAMAMPHVHIVPYVSELGFELSHGANMISLMLGFGIISRIASGWISDHIGGLVTLILGSALQGLVLLAFIFADTLTALYLTSAAFGLSQGGIVPSYSMIVRRYFPPSEAGGRIGLAFVFTILGMALGGWLAGALYDLSGSYTLSFVNAIGFNLINLVIAGNLYLRGRTIMEQE
jgi:MFS family permease